MKMTNINSKMLAKLCKASSDPLRLMIMRVLQYNSFGVLELTQLFSTTQSGMSHHLKILLQANLVTTRREGNTIFYRRTIPQVQQYGRFHRALLNEIDMLDIPDELKQRIHLVNASRANLSRAFFAALAQKGGFEQHDLIANTSHYKDTVLQLLDNLSFDASAEILEVGPGEGHFLPELTKRFNQVIALDNSVEMLGLAKQYCKAKQLQNIQWQQGDAMHFKLAQGVDCIVLNMVLHHLPAPAEAFKAFANNLKPQGSLLLTELCHHEQVWVREACGDIWLGFEPEELEHWAIAAGMQVDESLFIGLRNGFQLQIRRFHMV